MYIFGPFLKRKEVLPSSEQYMEVWERRIGQNKYEFFSLAFKVDFYIPELLRVYRK